MATLGKNQDKIRNVPQRIKTNSGLMFSCKKCEEDYQGIKKILDSLGFLYPYTFFPLKRFKKASGPKKRPIEKLD